jgi:hypothetical protein
MYIDFTQFVINKLIEKNNLNENNFTALDAIIENVGSFVIRPSITYGNNTDWSNIRRDEDWILTLQIFVNHGDYINLRDLANDLKRTIIKYCCSQKINGVYFSVNGVSFTSSFNTDFQSLSLLINVNSKEII